jgi:2-phosphosulfolactate phosphatase
MEFDPWPTDARVHVEWGAIGAKLAASRGDIVAIVDVLSFSTSVIVVLANGATALSYSNQEIQEQGGREKVEIRLNAQIISRDRASTESRFSLSPVSLKTVTPNDRIVLTSINGAHCVASASKSPIVIIGALINRRATAEAITRLLHLNEAIRCTLVACGELWSSILPDQEGMRPSIEDLIGAGAIAEALSSEFPLSMEAQNAVQIFNSNRDDLFHVLSSSISGRQLISRQFEGDVELASDLDSEREVAVWLPRNEIREFEPFSDVDLRTL